MNNWVKAVFYVCCLCVGAAIEVFVLAHLSAKQIVYLLLVAAFGAAVYGIKVALDARDRQEVQRKKIC
jgi:hypothetical protein